MNQQTLLFRPLLMVCATLLLTACDKPPQAPAAIRSVRTMVAASTPVNAFNTYAGEVRPRFESGLGFRVSGKIRQRLVNVGDHVAAGATLMLLDERDLALSEEASQAAVKAQEARFAVEKADFERFSKLAATKFISQTEFERQKTHFEAAKAQLEAVRAEARVSGNQTGYSTLRTENAGTVTAIEAESGQVVAAGQVVVRLAQAGEMEVAANIPESQLHGLATGAPVEVTLWAGGAQRLPAKIRELAASADPATRTYSMRVSVSAPPATMRLGMTASVVVPNPTTPNLIRVPLTAYTQYQGQAGVWIVNAADGTVSFRPAGSLGFDGNDILLDDQVKPGERIVTAGASLLHQGQQVRLLADPEQT